MKKGLISALFTREIKINGREIRVFLRDDADQSIFDEILLERDYKSLDPVIREAKFPIIDLGTHIGIFSIYCNAINPHVDLYCFEPDRDNFDLLKRNFNENNIKKARIKNLAVGKEEGQKDLFLSPDSHNHSLIYHDQVFRDKISVYTTTLEKVVKKIPSEKISLLKMDIEGSEFEVFEQVPDSVLNKIEHFFVEYHCCGRFDPNKIVGRLRKIGKNPKLKKSHYDDSMGFITL